MTMPFYVAPEQFMKDKADFARKNIGRGRPLVATVYGNGVLICAENSSRSLHKVSEIYDKIAFAGVGKYNEFDQLRRAGVQNADIKGYQFSREDVDARSLANLYAQYMGNVFTHEMKPLEVEILVAEVGPRPGEDQLFHILYDGTVVDEDRFSVLGGEADAITARFAASYRDGWSMDDGLVASVQALAGSERQLGADELEVAVLDRGNGRRAFRRVLEAEVAEVLARPRGSGQEETKTDGNEPLLDAVEEVLETEEEASGPEGGGGPAGPQ
ncbi:MAG TPA: proteasome subunit alpha [Acidimicrobiales bacterium]|nr:proteasome subunit alpha [Acidimicrobiales bacterium]